MKQNPNNAISPYSILRAVLVAVFAAILLFSQLSSKDSDTPIEEVAGQVLSAISTESMQGEQQPHAEKAVRSGRGQL